MSTENQISIGQHAKNNTVIVGDHNTIQKTIVQYVKKELTRNPYKFLSAYDVADKEIFFGREVLIEEVVSKVTGFKTTLLIGASGSGKSSLLQAGVIPRLTENDYTYVAFRDYTDPLSQLRTALADSNLSLSQDFTGLSLRQMLKMCAQQRTHWVIVFDQFEGFFNNVLSPIRRQFIEAVKEYLDPVDDIPVHFIFAMRQDFFGKFQEEFEAILPTFLNDCARINIAPLTTPSAREAIIKPLSKLDVKIGYDEEFVDHVLLADLTAQTGEDAGINPPHLQIVCNQLYREARQQIDSGQKNMVVIDNKLYDTLGKAEKILRTYLDDTLKDIIRQPEQTAQLQALLKGMVETTETRKFVTFEQLMATQTLSATDITDFLKRLQDRRVIEVLEREGQLIYSLSHDFMAAKVLKWFDASELKRKVAEETLERGLKEWKSSGTLLSEKQLSHVRDLGEKLPPQFNHDKARELLKKSEASWKRQRFLKRAGVVSLIFSTLGLAGYIYWYYYNYVWDYVTYCNAYTKHYGIMQCVGKLEAGAEKGRAISYKFIQKGRNNPIWKVQAIGGNQGDSNIYVFNPPTQPPPAERLTSNHTVHDYFKVNYTFWNRSPLQEAQWEFAVDTTGKIVYERAYDRFNNLVKGLVYSPAAEANTLKAHYVGADGYPTPPTGSEAEFIEISYTPEGYEKTIRFFDSQHVPRPLSVKDKVYVKEQKVNEQGLVIEEAFFDAEQHKATNQFGVHKVKTEYESNGSIKQRAFFDSHDQAIALPEGYHKMVFQYHETTGNLAEIAFFDINNQPTGSRYTDAHQFVYQYDERGNLIETAVFDKNQQPTTGYASTHDYLGLRNPSMMNPELLFESGDSYHKLAYKYDNGNNLIETSTFDADNLPTENQGLHTLKIDYDPVGNRIGESYFDKQGNKTNRERKVHKQVYSYISYQDRIIERSFFDTEGKPVAGIGNAFRVREKLNKDGNYLEQSFFNEFGKPIPSVANTVHKLVIHYDERGQNRGTSAFDTNNQPTKSSELGIYRTIIEEYIKDDWKYLEESYFDEANHPARRIDIKIHKIVIKQGEENDISVEERSFFDENGLPAQDSKTGTHRIRSEPIGMPSLETRWDTKGRKIFEREGLVKTAYWYDNDAKKMGCDSWIFTQDFSERLFQNLSLEEMKKVTDKVIGTCFDAQNKPIKFSYPDNFRGAHQIKTLRDREDRFVEMALFGIAGEPIKSVGFGAHKFKKHYDDENQTVETTYFDEKNQPTTNPSSIYKLVEKLNNRGSASEESYFDSESKPALSINGIHHVKYSYDANNRKVRDSYFDTDYQPTLSKDGIHTITYQYPQSVNAKANETAYFDVQGNPTVSNWSGIHKTKYVYDQWDNTAEQTFFDAQDRPIANKQGIHKIVQIYQEAEKLDSSFFYDVNGKRILVEVVVTEILPNSQAEKLGIHVGDVFLTYDGKPIADTDSFLAMRQGELDDGTQRALKVLRDGKELTFQVLPRKIGINFENRKVP